MANLTADYANFVKFITTAPTFFNQLAADAALLNKHIVAVSIFTFSTTRTHLLFLDRLCHDSEDLSNASAQIKPLV